MTVLSTTSDMSSPTSKLIALLRSITLLRTAAGSLSLKISAASLALINGILLARLLGPAEFGVYSIIFSVINFAATLAVLGLPMLVTREAAAHAEHGQWGKLKGVLRAAHRCTLFAATSIVCITAILLASGIVKLGVAWPVIAIAMAITPLMALNQLRAATLRGLHWVILADVPELLLRPLAMLIFLVIAYLISAHASAVAALSMQLITVILALGVGTWWLATKPPVLFKNATPIPPDRLWIAASLPFLAISLISMLEGQASLYLLGYLSGAEQAGLFQAANQLVGLIAIGLIAVNMPLQPKLAAAWARGDKQQAQHLISETARMGAAIGLVGVLFLLLFAEAMLRLYGQGYVEAAHALRLLAIGQLVNAAAGSCGILLLMSGHQRVVMQGTALALLLNLGVAYWAIPAFGVAGGALAAMLGMIFWNLYYVLYALKRLGLNTTVFKFKVSSPPI